MNVHEQKLQESGKYPLKAANFSLLEVNVGYKYNLRCTNYYPEFSPERKEEMSKEVMDKILPLLKNNDRITTVDITGGSPELNPYYKYFVKSAIDLGKKVMVRSNPAIFTEPGIEDIPGFLAQNKVKIIAFMPCVTEEAVDERRRKSTYKKIITVMEKLNKLGYGKEGTGLELDLVFNPGKPGLASNRAMFEKVLKENFPEMQGITFNNLIALNNAPVGRLRKITPEEEIETYEKELQNGFNTAATETAMCRHIIHVSYDGNLYDCECNMIMGKPINEDISTLDNFDYEKLSGREIITTPFCFICTTSAGTFCLPKEEQASECSASPASAGGI